MVAPGPRKDGRKSAKDVPDLAMLQSAVGFAVGGRFPLDSLAGRFPDIPRKCFVEKQRKLQARGLMSGWTLTGDGLAKLRELEDAE